MPTLSTRSACRIAFSDQGVSSPSAMSRTKSWRVSSALRARAAAVLLRSVCPPSTLRRLLERTTSSEPLRPKAFSICVRNFGGIGRVPAGTTAMTRGVGSTGIDRPAVWSARRRASAAVSRGQIAGLLAHKGGRTGPESSFMTTLSRAAVTVAVRAPPARNAISPIGEPGPISAIGASRPATLTSKRPLSTMNRASDVSSWWTSTPPRATRICSSSSASAARSNGSRSRNMSTDARE